MSAAIFFETSDLSDKMRYHPITKLPGYKFSQYKSMLQEFLIFFKSYNNTGEYLRFEYKLWKENSGWAYFKVIIWFINSSFFSVRLLFFIL
jgi:hypothetical protein